MVQLFLNGEGVRDGACITASPSSRSSVRCPRRRAVGSYDVEPVNPDLFLEAYRGFRDAFCMEAPANPRKGCKDP